MEITNERRRFLRSIVPDLHVLEARADGLLDFNEQKRIRAISEELRAMVCEVADEIDKGHNVKARIRYIRDRIALVI